MRVLYTLAFWKVILHTYLISIEISSYKIPLPRKSKYQNHTQALSK